MVQLAQENDFHDMYDIYGYYVKTSTATFDIGIPSFDTFSSKMRCNMKEAPCFVYKDNEQLNGYAYASPYKAKSGYDWTRELTIYLSPDHRAKGIGDQLYSNLIRLLKDQGYMKLMAAISYPNPHSEYFHAKHGFTQQVIFENIAYKFDKAQQVAWWSLDLKQDTPFKPIDYDYETRWMNKKNYK